MADAEISDYAAEAETLAERVDWARGSELTAALEELEAVSAAAPAGAGPHATSALVRLLAKNDCGPEATQRSRRDFISTRRLDKAWFSRGKKRCLIPERPEERPS